MVVVECLRTSYVFLIVPFLSNSGLHFIPVTVTEVTHAVLVYYTHAPISLKRFERVVVDDNEVGRLQ